MYVLKIQRDVFIEILEKVNLEKVPDLLFTQPHQQKAKKNKKLAAHPDKPITRPAPPAWARSLLLPSYRSLAVSLKRDLPQHRIEASGGGMGGPLGAIIGRHPAAAGGGGEDELGGGGGGGGDGGGIIRHNRRCRDLAFLVLFAAFWVAMIVNSSFGFNQGNPLRWGDSPLPLLSSRFADLCCRCCLISVSCS